MLEALIRRELAWIGRPLKPALLTPLPNLCACSAELAEAQQAAGAAREQAATAAERYRAQAEDWAHARQQLQTANEEVRPSFLIVSTIRAPQRCTAAEAR